MTSARSGNRRLGKGLEALLGEGALARDGGENLRRVQVSRISANPYQPRREFAEEELQELRESIRVNGLLQPPVVRSVSGRADGTYQLVAGERRLRCARDLGWTEIPVMIRDVDDRTLLVLALVENIQRENLGAIEEAEGYRVLVDEFGLTHGEIAEAVGKQRSTVANALRLLRLAPSVRKHLESGALSMGHARALLAIEDPARQAELARRAVEQRWSVREIEARVRSATGGGSDGKGASRTSDGKTGESSEPQVTPVLTALQEELRGTLGTRATIRTARGGAGHIEIPFHSTDDFERLFHLITGREAGDVAGG